MNLKWNKTSEKLPPEGKYVLGRHNRGTWINPRDQEGVNYVVVSLIRGITEEERLQLPECKRKYEYRSGDVFGNNLVPYMWECFGPDSFNGQVIEYWAEFNKVYDEKK